MKKAIHIILFLICSTAAFTQATQARIDTIYLTAAQYDSTLNQATGKLTYSLNTGMTPAQIQQLNTATADIKVTSSALANLQTIVANIPAATPEPQPKIITGPYTITAANHRGQIYANCSCTITLPAMFPGFWCFLIRDGSGTPTFKPGTGVTMTGSSTATIRQGYVLISYKTATAVNVSVR